MRIIVYWGLYCVWQTTMLSRLVDLSDRQTTWPSARREPSAGRVPGRLMSCHPLPGAYWGLKRDNGKAHGSYYNIIGYISGVSTEDGNKWI